MAAKFVWMNIHTFTFDCLIFPADWMYICGYFYRVLVVTATNYTMVEKGWIRTIFYLLSKLIFFSWLYLQARKLINDFIFSSVQT